ncbi:MAG: nucleotide-binding protein [Oscillospiraceae bacterium]|nr:nucleotide-binding protein [Oscillospiraceae bacterium]
MKIFMGSSKEALSHCDLVGVILEELGHTIVPWNESGRVFIPGQYTMDALIRKFDDVDAGVFVVSPDDIAQIRDKSGLKITRDNVWFEAGIMIGKKGKSNVVLCICDKDIHIPTDWHGITTIDISHDDKQHIIKRGFCAWIDNILPKPSLISPNVYLSSRRDVETLYTQKEIMDGTREENGTKGTKVHEIRLLNFAGTSILTPQYSDFYHRNEKISHHKVGEFLEYSLKNGAHLEMIINAPTPFVVQDGVRKINTSALDRDKQEIVFYSSYFAIRKLLENENEYKTAYEDNKRFDYHLTDIVLPFAIFEVIYKDEFAYMTHIKVDLYSAELDREENRRSMVIWKTEDPNNYDFFHRNYDAVRLKAWTRKRESKNEDEWRKRWKELVDGL